MMKEKMKIQQDIFKLKDNIIYQAENYLREFGEFFPFGACIEKSGELKPISVYFGDERPKSMEVLNNLEAALKDGIANNKYIAVAIGIDIITTLPNTQNKVDAIEIRIDHKDHDPINYYLPYKKQQSGDIIFYDAFEQKGTLNIYQ